MLAALVLAQLATSSSPSPSIASLSAEPPPVRPWEMTSQLSPAGGIRCDARDCTAVFALALRVDVLYRPGDRAFGVGPFLSTRSDNFADLASALGVSVLVPVSPVFPLIASAGASGRIDATGLAAGALERIEWGPRSYNYHSPYTLSGGVFVESRQWFLGANEGFDVVLGLDLDLELAAIPFMAMYTWIARTDRRH